MVTGIANQNPILTLGVQTLGDNAVTTATDTLTADAGKTIANSFVGGICSAVAVAGPILNVQMQPLRRARHCRIPKAMTSA